MYAFSYSNLGHEESEAFSSFDKAQTGKFLFGKNPGLWKQSDEISARLGWLTLPDQYEQNAEMLVSFSLQIKEEGFKHAVLLGMGGSSLCSEVALNTFGSKEGYLNLLVLDNTDPVAILNLESKIELDKTLFIVASKSGNTEETICFFRYFYDRLEKGNSLNPGNHFIAITDADTPLVKVATHYKFKKVFINPSDLGGRFSVLSDFGLVPMALMGIDINSFLASSRRMKRRCIDATAASNPGIGLGIVLGICQKDKRDKVTFVLSSSIRSFGLWLEQLLAESTGKDGKGLIPVNGESLGNSQEYGNDRIFVHMYLASDDCAADEKNLLKLEETGQPVIRICISDKIELGAEYYRWEIAVAVAGMAMKINPFDQPNVEESKKNTAELLKAWTPEDHFGKFDSPSMNIANISIYTGKESKFLEINHCKSLGELVGNFVSQAGCTDYIALLPYFLLTDSRKKILQSWRQEMNAEFKVATTLLNGPRYLHSTGQLHKGGPNSGIYIILCGEEGTELPIPGKKFGFSVLKQAQALGDFRALDDKKRRVIRIHFGASIDDGLEKLHQYLIHLVI